MSNVKTRLAKLERQHVIEAKEPILKILLVDLETDNKKPIGYSCNGVEVFRQSNESRDEVINRLGDLLECPDKPTLYSVESIYGTE